MKLSKAQKAIVDTIIDAEKHGHELSNIGKGYNKLSPKSAEFLLNKGIITIEQRSRFREDDRETVYWWAYKLVPSSLEKELT